MNEINKGFFEEIKELDEEQNYSSGFNSQRSGDKGINESKYSQMKGSVIDEEDIEEVFTDEENEDIIERENGDFVNLETPMNMGKTRGMIDKENQSGVDQESSGDEVGMFEFKGMQGSEEESRKLIVSEAFVEEVDNLDKKEEGKEEENIVQEEGQEGESGNREKEYNKELEYENSKPGNEANPNTPLINKGKVMLCCVFQLIYKYVFLN